MNRMTLIVGEIIVVAAIVGFALLKNKPRPAPAMETTTVTQGDGAIEKETNAYVPYSASAFASAADKKRVLYFYADWCPVCRPIDKEFSEKSDQIPSDIVVFKTNYNTEKDLKTKYGVTYQHTFVQVDAEGHPVASWNGGGLNELEANVK